MESFYIKSDRIFMEKEIVKGFIKISGQYIVDISTNADDGIKILDFTDKIVSPGFFDTHIHGYDGYDVMDCTEEAIIAISQGIVENGVTSFLPTTLTDTEEKLEKACEVIAKSKDKCTGAKIQGIFLEGPFFTQKYKGAQNPKYMQKPSFQKLEKWIKKSDNNIKKIAIAPEKDGSLEFIEETLKKEPDIKIALGHSDATYQEAIKAIEKGASIFVHTFNGMSPLHHRNPGMVGAAFASDKAYTEVICDGHHVDKNAIKILLKIKPDDKVVLITDCMRAGGKENGIYKLGDFDVKVEEGTARLVEGGSLAGSILTLDKAVKNIVHWDITNLQKAINMASIIPAKSLGLEKEIGSIEKGKYADLNVLDEDLNIIDTFINGVKTK